MDAASKIHSFLIALGMCCGTTAMIFAQECSDKCAASPSECPCAAVTATTVAKKCDAAAKCCDETAGCSAEIAECAKTVATCCDPQSPCCTETAKCCDEHREVVASSETSVGLLAFASEWLAKTPKFHAQFAIHFGPGTAPVNKLGADAPQVAVITHAKATCEAGVCKTETPVKPLQFITEQLPCIQCSGPNREIVICGHRICSGDKCYDVEDHAVAGKTCDAVPLQDTYAVPADSEPIMVAPIAPPAPPIVEVAMNSMVPTQASRALDSATVSMPVSSVVELVAAKAELLARLEMAEQMMQEREIANERIQTLLSRNAELSAQVAVAESRQQLSEALTVNLVERAAQAIKMASTEAKPTNASSQNFVQTIQEDLSNIRRQIALLRRPQPVPFAPSFVGQPAAYVAVPTYPTLEPNYHPYVPTANLQPAGSALEVTCSGGECEAGEGTVK